MQIHELGHIVLYVSDLMRSADFYRNTLGFNEISRDTHTALFSSGRTHHELLLIEVGVEARQKSHPSPGLYHIGFKIGTSDEELRNALRELRGLEVPVIGTADHHVTHSVYILDPDGNELELYVDINDVWKSDPRVILRPARKLNL